MIALLITVTVALGISFLCSILEAAVFSVRDTELSERAAKGESSAQRLKHIKDHRLDDAISSILILNTIAHTIGAAMAGAQAADVFGDAWVGVFSGVLTLLVLVMTEIIPKTIGAVYASRLVGFVATALAILMKLLHPLLLVTRAITRLVAHGEQGKITRGEVRAMVETASEMGLLQAQESKIVKNALHLGRVQLDAVMTPRTVVQRISADLPASSLLEPKHAVPFTRIPLFKESEENIVGYVLIPEVLRACLDGRGDVPLGELARELPTFDEHASVGEALRALMSAGDHIALVQDSFGGMAGIVTLEDLMETLLGAEIIDESDEVADLRQLAIELRDKRKQRYAAKAPPATKEPSADES